MADDDDDLTLHVEAGDDDALHEREPATELTIDEAELDAALDAVAADESGHDSAFRRAAAKVRQFPRSPGVYLMKFRRPRDLCRQS